MLSELRLLNWVVCFESNCIVKLVIISLILVFVGLETLPENLTLTVVIYKQL